MSQNKTQKTKESVFKYLSSIEDKQQRADSKAIDKMMQGVVGCKGAMWGDSIIGYGDIELKYASGRELDWFNIGFSPRKGKISLYLLCPTTEYDELLATLGKYQRGKGCLYIKTLGDINTDILRQIMNLEATVK